MVDVGETSSATKTRCCADFEHKTKPRAPRNGFAEPSNCDVSKTRVVLSRKLDITYRVLSCCCLSKQEIRLVCGTVLPCCMFLHSPMES
jgi:hypothetical protein